MKLYILPVEKACNAKCKWCITNFRETASREFLELGSLERVLEKGNFDKIEITGGGEPTLHPSINRIIEMCAERVDTQLYTNGSLLSRISSFTKLKQLCISIAHYDMKKNHEIMGIYPDLLTITNMRHDYWNNVKLSLLLHKSGIHTKDEVLKYFDWANNWAEKVVVRQMFEHDYRDALKGEFISSEKIFKELRINDFKLTKHGNPVFQYGNLEVEVEYRSCACEMNNPVLHADGKLHKGWSQEVLNDSNRK